MRSSFEARAAAVLFCGGVLAARCAGPGPAAPPSAASARAATPSAPGCERGTLGLEAGPLTRPARKNLSLPASVAGAVVTEVLPGGPASAAGIRVGDVVQEIGGARITNVCELGKAAFHRSCEPVRVLLRRAGTAVETKLTPVDQDLFLEKSCRDGIASGCFREAWLLRGRDSGTDRARALELYRKACEAGSAEACAYEGRILIGAANRGGRDTVALLRRACDRESGAGCATLAFLHATGSEKLVAKDDRRATALYVKSCELGDAMGCYNVGLMADEGRGGARDAARAAAKYDEACEMGSSSACTNLGFLYENGRGVKKDRARAAALYQRGCDGGSCQPPNRLGCVNLGRAYRDGTGVEKDAARAAAIFRDACDRKPDPDDDHAAENSARSCSLLGALHLAGDGVPADLARGRELSELGCERGDSFGCFNAAAIFSAGQGVKADTARAAVFLDKACKAGDGEGCHDLGVAYEKGSGVVRDPRRAAELARRACELGFQPACAKKGK